MFIARQFFALPILDKRDFEFVLKPELHNNHQVQFGIRNAAVTVVSFGIDFALIRLKFIPNVFF